MFWKGTLTSISNPMRISVSKICAILRAEGLSRFLLRCTLLITLLTQSIEACKLWAVCTTSGMTFSNLSEESSSMIQSELTSFYHQSAMMLDGWSILGYQDSFHQETISICRSPNTAPNFANQSFGNLYIDCQVLMTTLLKVFLSLPE